MRGLDPGCRFAHPGYELCYVAPALRPRPLFLYPLHFPYLCREVLRLGERVVAEALAGESLTGTSSASLMRPSWRP